MSITNDMCGKGMLIVGDSISLFEGGSFLNCIVFNWMENSACEF